MSESLPHLGLVCITSSDEIRYRTITRTHLLKHDPALRGDRLTELYRSNLDVLGRAVDWCRDHQLKLYRIPSSLFPFADSPYGSSILESLAPDLSRVGEKIAQTGLRVVCHPDQFVVLSSDSRAVVENSRAVLAFQSKVMDLLDLPRSAWATIEIHGGKGDRSEQLIRVIDKLEPPVRTRLALENDERTYGAEEILKICRQAKIPMVFDAHHHVVKEKITSYDDPSVEKYLHEAACTWPDAKDQLVHISNGRDGISDLRHHDFIDVMPQSYAHAPWIEVEAKLKEQAIARLRTNWGPVNQMPGLRSSAPSNRPETKKKAGPQQ